MYSSTSSLTSTLDGVGGEPLAPTDLHRGMTRYPLYKRLGGTQGRSGGVKKFSPPTGIRSLDKPSRNELLHRLKYSGEGKEYGEKDKREHTKKMNPVFTRAFLPDQFV